MQFLEDAESATQFLQDEKFMTFCDVRTVFDDVIDRHGDKFPCLNEALKADASIVANKHFESGVNKLQLNLEILLTSDEKEAIKCFLIPPPAVVVIDEELPTEEAPMATTTTTVPVRTESFHTRMNKKLKTSHEEADARLNTSKYRSTAHVKPTSNKCERLFSQAKLIKGDRRRSMLPCNLEICLFLKENRALWGVSDLQKIINKGIDTLDEIV